MTTRYAELIDEANEKVRIAHAICAEALRRILRDIERSGSPHCASVMSARELLEEADAAHMAVLEISRQASVRISAPEPEKIKLPLEAAL